MPTAYTHVVEHMSKNMRQITQHRFIFVIFIVALISALPTGCTWSTVWSNSQVQFPNFEETIGVQEFPTNLKLESLASSNQLVGGSSIDLLITNDSGYSIRFSPGYGSKIFVYDGVDKDWIEVQNLVNYVGGGDVLGSKSNGSDNLLAYLTVAPDLPEFHTYEILRIAVVGVRTDSSDLDSPNVGAFIDIPFDIP
jgi:hypothetical protein